MIVRTSVIPPNEFQGTIISAGPAGHDSIQEAEPECWRPKPSCWAHRDARVVSFVVDSFDGPPEACLHAFGNRWRANSQVAGHHASAEDPSRCDGASERRIKSPKDHKNKETGQIGAVQLTLVRNGEPSIP